jgi:hypothetical protein
VEGQRFASTEEVTAKSVDSTDRSIKKWFPGMLPKVLGMLAKGKKKGTTLKEMLCK